MAITQSSLKANALFVTESGVQRLDGRPFKGKRKRSLIIVSRALLRYHFLTQPEGVSARQSDKAAIVFAEAHAPFSRADFVVVRAVRGHGVWWWDSDRVSELIGSVTTYDKDGMIPESVLYDLGTSWRLVNNREGFEAQYWRDMTLVASTWRRRPFTAEQWQAFLAPLDGQESAPSEPPPQVEPKIISGNLKRLPLVRRTDLLPVIEAWMWAAAVVLACVASWFGAQWFQFDQSSTANRIELTKIAERQGTAASLNQLRPDQQTLALMVAESDRPNPLLVGAEVVATASSLGIVPTRWEVEEGKLRFEMAASDRGSSEQLAGFLERHPWISNVRPQLDPATGAAVFLADVCQKLKDAACSESATPVERKEGR